MPVAHSIPSSSSPDPLLQAFQKDAMERTKDSTPERRARFQAISDYLQSHYTPDPNPYQDVAPTLPVIQTVLRGLLADWPKQEEAEEIGQYIQNLAASPLHRREFAWLACEVLGAVYVRLHPQDGEWDPIQEATRTANTFLLGLNVTVR